MRVAGWHPRRRAGQAAAARLARCPATAPAPQRRPTAAQEGEDPSLAKPVTENLNAVLQLLEYSAVSWARLGEGGVKEVFATAQARLPPC